jgi:CBS domain-containing protein
MAAIGKQVSREVVALEATAPVREAARLMADRRIGSVAVRDGAKLVGLVTERDLMLGLCARGGDPGLPIREVMRPGVPRVSASASEAEVAALMRDHQTRHLLVEEDGQVVGVISMRDLIQLMLDEKEHMISQLHTYIEGR